MVGIDPVSQSIETVAQLRDYHQVPVCAIHAPCLLITQRVWGTDPWGKLERSAEMAKDARRRRGRRAPAVPVAARLRDAASSRGSPTSSVVPASPSRSRTCTRGGPRRGARCRSTNPGWDPLGGGLRQHHHRPLARRHRAVRPDRDGRAPRRPAAPRAHDRRQRLAEGRAPRARATATSRARRCSSCSPTGASTGTSWSRSTPARPATARHARPTCSRRSRSAGCNFAPAKPDASEPRARPRRPPPAAPDTRAEILAAARSLFADAWLREHVDAAIAGEAGVDPALVHHYFGTKDDLFVAAAAAARSTRGRCWPRSSRAVPTARGSGCCGSS